MPSLFVLLNHEMTSKQKQEAHDRFVVDDIVRLPKPLKELWARIPVEGELDQALLSRFTDWLEKNAKKGDYILIQGEFGAAFYLVDFCFSAGFIPIYATSPRRSTEEMNGDGTVERKLTFYHTNFRRYRKHKKAE